MLIEVVVGTVADPAEAAPKIQALVPGGRLIWRSHLPRGLSVLVTDETGARLLGIEDAVRVLLGHAPHLPHTGMRRRSKG